VIDLLRKNTARLFNRSNVSQLKLLKSTSSDIFRAPPVRHGSPSVDSAGAMHYAAKSILVMLGGSCFSSILPSPLIFASSALSSAPTSMAKPVQ